MNKSDKTHITIKFTMEHKFSEFLVDRIVQTYLFRRNSNYRYIFDTFEYITDYIKINIFSIIETDILNKYE